MILPCLLTMGGGAGSAAIYAPTAKEIKQAQTKQTAGNERRAGEQEVQQCR